MVPPKVALLLVALAVVLLPWLLWRVPAVRRVAPLAVVQIVAGVLLGPSGLGRVAPELHKALFPPEVLGPLGGLASFGVLLYVFVSGLHLDADALRRDARRLGGPALGSILLPLLLGLGAGWWIGETVPGAAGGRGDRVSLAIAVAICVAVTALPVLAAMLREMGMITSRLGQSALAIAALNDAALWLMILVLLALAHGSAAEAAWASGLSLLWLAAMLVLVRPLLSRLAARFGQEAMLPIGLSAAILSAAATEAVGLGFIIGAFVAGAVVPAGTRAALLARIEPLTAAALLPFFFVSTGLRAFIDPASPAFFGMLLAVTAATVLGKVAGTALPARAAGQGWRDALALGALVQTKGLIEVVVLAVLLDAGLIGPAAFSAMVAMAVVCTVVAAPLMRLALGRAAPVPDGALPAGPPTR